MGVVPTGKPALSRVTPIAFDGKLSLSKVAIETGRTHQIRVHMAHLRSKAEESKWRGTSNSINI